MPRCIAPDCAGVDRKRIVIDPGLGFGKRREQNAEILAQLGELARLELPMLVGPSRKHFLARESADRTEFATAAAVAAGDSARRAPGARSRCESDEGGGRKWPTKFSARTPSSAADKPDSNVSHGQLPRSS